MRNKKPFNFKRLSKLLRGCWWRLKNAFAGLYSRLEQLFFGKKSCVSGGQNAH